MENDIGNELTDGRDLFEILTEKTQSKILSTDSKMPFEYILTEEEIDRLLDAAKNK